jgi:hypothetical protein
MVWEGEVRETIEKGYQEAEIGLLPDVDMELI